MQKDERPKYQTDQEEEDFYGLPKEDIGLREKDVVTEKEFLVKEVRTPRRVAVQKPEDDIESIKRVAPEIIGGLLERVQFLEERIADVKESIEDRKSLHKEMIKDIEDDMAEKKTMESRLTDIDEKRNLKLDISQLRRDKRNEMVRFWKDLFELRSELKELAERYEVESRIKRIFKDIDLKGGKK